MEQRKQPDEAQGLAELALERQVSVHELPLRRATDKGREGVIRTAAQAKLLASAGFTTERAQTELSPVAAAEAAPKAPEKVVAPERKAAILASLEARFAEKPERYCEGINPADVKKALEAASEEQWYGLDKMEENGHEVRVVRAAGAGGKKGFRFDSCSQQSPAGLRDINYYRAEEIAKEWGIDLMDTKVFEEMRRKYGIDSSTWDHLKTDAATLKTGYSFYGDRYGVDRVSADFHTDRGGFRGSLWVSEA